MRYASQDPDWQLFAGSVSDELNFGGKWNKALPDYRKILQKSQIDVPFDLQKSPFNLSYGQRKYLTLLCIFTLGPTVVLLDEPFAGLDDITKEKVVQWEID